MSKAARALGFSTALAVLATIFTGLRAVTRFVILKQSYADDYLILVSIALSWALEALIFAQAQFGLGQHYDQLAPGEYQKMLKFFWASIPIYGIALTITKISVLFQFLRFFVTRKTRIASWALIGVIICFGIASFIATILSCQPVEFFWDRTIRGGKCIDLLAFWYSSAAFNIITDIAIIVLPIQVFTQLQMPKKQKWAVTAIFAFGGFSCITSIIRLYSLHVVAESKDVTWNNAAAAMWSAIELNTAIMCACMPALKPLVRAVAPRWLSLSTNSTSTSPTVGNTSKSGHIKKTMDIEVKALIKADSETSTSNNFDRQSEL